MNYFVTGGAGFIGSNYVRGLLAGLWGRSPSRVTVYDALTYAGNRMNLREVYEDERLRFVHGDVRDEASLRSALDGSDVIVHFAAESHVDRSISDGSSFLTTNVTGTYNVLRAALDSGVATFVHVSTDEVYGSIEEGSWDEQCPLLPNSPYAASKAASDLVARSFHRTHGLDVRVTRCSNNFGPYQHPEKLIPAFITRLLSGLRVPLYGDGLNVRDWLHVDDHCRAIEAVVESGRAGEVYNIGGGTESTNLDLTNRIVEILGLDASRIERVTDRPGHDRRYALDWSKARNELGYIPVRDLFTELPSVVDWYRDNEEWWRPSVDY